MKGEPNVLELRFWTCVKAVIEQTKSNALRTNSIISFHLSYSLYGNSFGSSSLKKVISVVSLTKERHSKHES
ncbi:hypothetical protein BpHYR1_028890 [Brachionus plicatilis]|uniref:Uncharacterized protein n=1 Tax=Brachionus plicatilis TaxID=10195 RepID=A0A3M7RZT3_BRAPC|nr:hypothetical protein BpHYR1_028890 [Brachionus plicatilis]